MLNLAGIDINNLKAQSVKSASNSSVASAGVITNQIKEVANWSSESVFQRFYYKLMLLELHCYQLLPQVHYKHYVFRAFQNVL